MDILLTGSVAYDYLMTFPGYFMEQILPERLGPISLLFLVDSMSRRRGGIALNIAFDVTPHRLVTAIFTENVATFPPFEVNLKRVFLPA